MTIDEVRAVWKHVNGDKFCGVQKKDPVGADHLTSAPCIVCDVVPTVMCAFG